MKITRWLFTAASAAALSGFASAALWVPRGTEVDLRFDQYLSSNHAKPGERVRMEVARNVMVDGHVVLRAGTPVQGIVSRAQKNGRYGVNGELRIVIEPIRATDGRSVPVQPRDEGKMLGGKRTGEAAVATVGGAVLLGPIGLVGGYFIAGKQVHVKPGEGMRTEVARSVKLT